MGFTTFFAVGCKTIAFTLFLTCLLSKSVDIYVVMTWRPLYQFLHVLSYALCSVQCSITFAISCLGYVSLEYGLTKDLHFNELEGL